MIRKQWLTAAVTALNTMILAVAVRAQQSAPDVDVNVGTQGGGAWYGQWYVWAIGIGVFLLLVIALTNRGSRQN